ncbi:MAG: HAMP domain-containing protein [Gemmataceae bacterium]|nr:HAMP domain-containing protein [Gemmataceae bacterium]
MSYRAFKRLLGETSLERKCRFLFGAGALVLITISFWIYAYQTEHLAYDQTITTCRFLVTPIFERHHLPLLIARQKEYAQKALEQTPPEEREALAKLFEKSTRQWENLLQARAEADNLTVDKLGGLYQWRVMRENQFEDSYERELFKEFRKADEPKVEATRLKPGEKVLLYYAPIRANKQCLDCHRRGNEGVTEDAVMAMVHIRMPTKAIEDGVHLNRAVLMAIALVTALLIMSGSYIIVRYVIVKPVKHLKEVSDAISAGELNVRSEIQTGDEFEDLSHAFNRMLRNLVSMQDQWRKVNADLDHKVDELAQANMALYESNRLKSNFLATMSHELRTPLNSILGFSEVLLSSNALTDKQQRWVRNIKSSGDRLLALINDILDLAKIEAGKMQVRLEDFSVHDVCEGMLNMFRPLAEKKNIDLRGQMAPDIPTLRQDVGKLQQILQNLLSNAIKFTPEGGRVQLRAEVEAPYVVLTVADTGVGIAPEEQELVFEKFRQSGNPLTREHAGTGLGLSIVREIAKLLGGEVTLQSELGRGSTFAVRLPLHLSEEPRLEFDLASERIDLSKAQRVDVRLYAAAPPSHVTRVDRREETQVDLPVVPNQLQPETGPQSPGDGIAPTKGEEGPRPEEAQGGS